MDDVHENVIEEWCARVCVYLHAASKGPRSLKQQRKGKHKNKCLLK